MRSLRALLSPARVVSAASKAPDRFLPEQLEDRRLLATLSGVVYVDLDNDGVRDKGEAGIAGVTLTLTGTTSSGKSVNQTVKTDSKGVYAFYNVAVGTYALAETQPSGYADGKETIGSLGGQITGNDVISGIHVARKDACSCSGGYNFGERPIPHEPPPPPPPPEPQPTPTKPLEKGGTTATIGFWQNKNGQSLLKSLNGSASATQLGNWLATTFPRLYGGVAGSIDLSGKTNAEVAGYFKTLFSAKTKGPKLEAQVLGLAFAVYVTDTDLAGTVAAKYGFKVSAGGTGAMTWNVGGAGAAFGVANNTTLSVLQILKALDARASGGVIWNGNHGMRSAANDVVDAINRYGDRH